MLVAFCESQLLARVGRERVYRTSLFVTGRSESHVEEAVQPVAGQVWVPAAPCREPRTP